jgi:hypothetical protein
MADSAWPGFRRDPSGRSPMRGTPSSSRISDGLA